MPDLARRAPVDSPLADKASEVPADQGARIVALLEQVLVEARLTRLAIERMGPPNRLQARDRENLARILPAARRGFADVEFTARELAADPNVRSLIRSRSDRDVERSLGLLLGRAADSMQPIAGLIVQRYAVEAHTVLWRVVSISSGLLGVERGLEPA